MTLVKSVLVRPESARIFLHQSIAGLLEWSAVRRSDRSGTLPAPFVFVDQRVNFIDPALWQLYFQVSAAAAGS